MARMISLLARTKCHHYMDIEFCTTKYLQMLCAGTSSGIHKNQYVGSVPSVDLRQTTFMFFNFFHTLGKWAFPGCGYD